MAKRRHVEKEVVDGANSIAVQQARENNKKTEQERQRALASKEQFITLPLGLRKVQFELVTIPHNDIASCTKVFNKNARDQDFLNEHSLSDILKTLPIKGQQFPAVGQRMPDGSLRVFDGSRRRKACLLSEKDFLIYVTDEDVTDEEAKFQSDVGNDHKQISAYERGEQLKRDFEASGHSEVKAFALENNLTASLTSDLINAVIFIPKNLLLTFPSATDLGRPSLNELRQAIKKNDPVDLDVVIAQANDARTAINTNISLSAMNKEHLKHLLKIVNSKATKPQAPKALNLKSSRNGANARIVETSTGFNISLKKLSHSQKKQVQEIMQEFLNS